MQSQYQHFFGEGFILETERILLRLMKPEDFELLAPLTGEQEIWAHFTKDLSSPQELKDWMEEAFHGRKAETRMPFVIIDKDSGDVCGATSFGNISFYDKRIEIGWTWLGAATIGKGVNFQVKFAMLSFAFEAMKMERVEIKTDALNARSVAAILKIGMKPEGILRSHTLMHSNRRRDTAYFSIIRSEWPEVKYGTFRDMM
jgi:RimJ/RimL family protein N-acetyltransferase